MSLFKPNVSIIIGGGSGIGANIAKELASRGTQVIVADKNEENAAAVSREIGERAEAIMIDATDPVQVQKMVDDIKVRFNNVDCLINCAGISFYGEARDTPIDTWSKVISTNLMGTIIPSMAAYQIMSRQGNGTIINFASMAVFLIDPLFSAYTTSKFGVFGFSRALSTEARFYGVRVCVVCPGNIRTPLLQRGRYKTSRITPEMPVELAVKRILTAVDAGRHIIVFPFHTRLFWLLDRISPSLLNPLRREIFRRAKQRLNR